jgi:hypothetical protein
MVGIVPDRIELPRASGARDGGNCREVRSGTA